MVKTGARNISDAQKMPKINIYIPTTIYDSAPFTICNHFQQTHEYFTYALNHKMPPYFKRATRPLSDSQNWHATIDVQIPQNEWIIFVWKSLMGNTWLVKTFLASETPKYTQFFFSFFFFFMKYNNYYIVFNERE